MSVANRGSITDKAAAREKLIQRLVDGLTRQEAEAVADRLVGGPSIPTIPQDMFIRYVVTGR